MVLPRQQPSLNFRILSRDSEKSNEINRLCQAVADACRDLQQARCEMATHNQSYAGILDAHLLLLEDKFIKDHAITIINEQMVNAEWALSLTLNKAEERFKYIKDSYIRERFKDISAVIDHIIRHLSGQQRQPLDVREKIIMVVNDLSPADISRLDANMVMGLAAEQGGPTSHTAIMARAMGIPAVLGIDRATSLVCNGATAIINGTDGELLINPSDETISIYRDRRLAYDVYIREIVARADQPAYSLDGLRVEIGANIELLEEVSAVHRFGAENVGLYRTEFVCLSYQRTPTEEEMYVNFEKMVLSLRGLPVCIRTLDVGGDKMAGFSADYHERNPNLGLRAIRYSLKDRGFFLSQLRAILRASHLGPVQILLPLISSVDEVEAVNICLEEAKEHLRRRGQPYADSVPKGIMIEVPAAVVMSDVLAGMVDFFSIGTNDLIQYCLAIDRDNEQVAGLYQPMNPAVLRLIHMVVDTARRADIPLSICGEMAGNPRYAPLLLGLGVEKLSMKPLNIPRIKEVVRMADVRHWREVVRNILNLPKAGDVEKLLHDELLSQMPSLFAGD
jgi:phosphotransferase system enzyme I (PtsI)